MRSLTFLRSDGSTYIGTHAELGAVPIKPAPSTDHVYNPEVQEWELKYELPKEDDISLTDAEVLWTKAHKENDVVAGVLLKMLQL